MNKSFNREAVKSWPFLFCLFAFKYFYFLANDASVLDSAPSGLQKCESQLPCIPTILVNTQHRVSI